MHVHACIFYTMSDICSIGDQTYMHAKQTHYKLSYILNQNICTVNALTTPRITKKAFPAVLQKEITFFPTVLN